MINNEELVSVIIAAYNPDVKDLEIALESIFNQTYFNIEILIGDDGSDIPVTETLNLIDIDSMNRNKTKIKVLRNKFNKGISSARNLAVSASTGKWLIWLDADDKLSTDCVERLFQVSSGKHIVIGECIVYEHEKIFYRNPNLYLEAAKKDLKTQNDPFLLNIIALQPQLFLKNTFIQLGMFDESYMFAELSELFLRYLSVHGIEKVQYADHAFYHYKRGRPTSVSAQRDQLFFYRKMALIKYMNNQKIPGADLAYIGRNLLTGVQTYEIIK